MKLQSQATPLQHSFPHALPFPFPLPSSSPSYSPPLPSPPLRSPLVHDEEVPWCRGRPLEMVAVTRPVWHSDDHAAREWYGRGILRENGKYQKG